MKRRSQLLISDEVQYSLLRRVTVHWVLFLIANFFMLAVWVRFIELPLATSSEQYEAFLRLILPITICSLVVVPVFLYDITKLSNQFAGPIMRIRNGMTSFLAKEQFVPVNLRKNDFWQALASDFNRVIEIQSAKLGEPVESAKSSGTYPEA